MDELEIPPWLDESFLATALQGGDDAESKVKVLTFSAERAVAKGNNYTSNLFRVKEEYTDGAVKDTKTASLIVKAPLTAGMGSDMADMGLYEKEPKMYNKVLPAMSKEVGYNFGPEALHSSVGNAMILKDLREEGYQMGDRRNQLDFYHCEHVLKTLAKFHAASVVCMRDKADLFDGVTEDMLYSKNAKFETVFKPFTLLAFKSVAEAIEDIDGSKSAAELILSCAEESVNSLTEICKPKKSGLNVLNHGDLWCNNILFKYNDSDEVVDVKFIDFQITRYTSPAIDLNYFFWTSSNDDVRENHLSELCETYRKELNTTLEQLKCDERLSEEELRKDLHDSLGFVLVVICGTLPFIICDGEDAVNLEEVTLETLETVGSNSFAKMYSGKRYKSLFPKIIIHYRIWSSSINSGID